MKLLSTSLVLLASASAGLGCSSKAPLPSASEPAPAPRRNAAAPAVSSAPNMPPTVDQLPTSIVDDRVEEAGVLRIDKYEDDESADLIKEVRAFLQSCDSIYEGMISEESVGKCYASSVHTLLFDADGNEFRSEGLREYVSTQANLRTKHSYREVFDTEVGLSLFQYRKDSPWYYALYDTHQNFDGSYFKGNRVAVLKREGDGFRIHRERILRQQYDLDKSPPRTFVEVVGQYTGAASAISLKENSGAYDYEIHIEYAEGIELRKGTLSKDGWVMSEYLEFEYCVNSGYESDLCYERKLKLTFDPKSRRLKSAKGFYKDWYRESGKTVAEFRIKNIQGLAKARRYAEKEVSGESEHLKPFFTAQIPAELLKATEWVY